MDVGDGDHKGIVETALGTVAGGTGWGACWWQCFRWPQLLMVLRTVDISKELSVVLESVSMG